MVTISPQTQGEIITQSTIAAIAQTIATQIKPQQILLFGSYASGTPTEDSDLDLLIVMETDRPKNKRSTPHSIDLSSSPMLYGYSRLYP